MQDVNFNFNSVSGLERFSFAPPILPDTNVNGMLSELFGSMAKLFEILGASQFHSGTQIPQCGCTSMPSPIDSCHPSGSLNVSGDKITTPGGYTIEASGQFEWKITGPDGKSTRVWGDPHVAESDGGKWDFKRNSTFVLPDGTRVNVSTKPWGSGGMTVASGLEVINGNDRVVVTGIDQGKGVIGPVTKDGFQQVNSFAANDVFVMGNETDDWSFRGKEIVGSNNGGDSFKLGNDLAPGSSRPATSILDFLKQLFGNWDENWRPNDFGSNPYYEPIFGSNGVRQYDGVQHRQQMAEMFKALAGMFDTLARFTDMNETLFVNRNRALMV